MARPYALQKAQYGIESTFGTSVAAGKQFSSVTLTLGPENDSKSERAAGKRFNTNTYPTKVWSKGTIEGTPCYNDLKDIFTLVFGAPTTTEVEAGVQSHAYELGNTAKSATVEYGDSTGASKATGVIATGLKLGWGRNSGDATVSAEILGGKIADGVTLTASPTSVTPASVTASEVTGYADDTLGSIGTTVANFLKADIDFGTIRGQHYVLDQSKTSASESTELSAEGAKVNFTVANNAAGLAWLADLYAGETKYLRFEAVGAEIGSTGEYLTLTVDLCVQIAKIDRTDEDGSYASSVECVITEDSTGFSHAIVLQNAIA